MPKTIAPGGLLAPAIFGVSTIITVGFRFFLLLTQVDASTGFYNHSSAAAGFSVAFLVLLALCSAAIVFVSYKQLGSGQVPYSRFTITGPILLVVLALFALWNTLFDAFNKMMALISGYPIDMLAAAVSIVTILGAFGLLAIGFSAIMRKSKVGGGNFVPSFLVLLWLLVLLVSTFLSYPVVYNVSDNMLHILALCAVVYLFLSYCRLLIDVPKKRLRAQIVTFGYLTAYFGFTLALTRLTLLYADRINLLVKAPAKSDLIILFILACFGLVCALDASKPQPILEALQEDSDEQGA